MSPPFLDFGVHAERHGKISAFGDSYRPLQPRRPIFNLCHAAQYRTIDSAEKFKVAGCRRIMGCNFSAEYIVRY